MLLRISSIVIMPITILCMHHDTTNNDKIIPFPVNKLTLNTQEQQTSYEEHLKKCFSGTGIKYSNADLEQIKSLPIEQKILFHHYAHFLVAQKAQQKRLQKNTNPCINQDKQRQFNKHSNNTKYQSIILNQDAHGYAYEKNNYRRFTKACLERMPNYVCNRNNTYISTQYEDFRHIYIDANNTYNPYDIDYFFSVIGYPYHI